MVIVSVVLHAEIPNYSDQMIIEKMRGAFYELSVISSVDPWYYYCPAVTADLLLRRMIQKQLDIY